MQEITLEEALGLSTLKILQNPTLTPNQLSIIERRNKIIGYLIQRVAVVDIAKKLGVDRSTIYADFEEWVKTEQATYLQVEWLQQYELMKQENPEEAFQALTKLVMKLLEKQAKIEVNVTQNTQINIRNEVEQLIKFSRARAKNAESTTAPTA